MDCFHDFCLACDRESLNGPYCSQACKLADLEKASVPSSPIAISTPFKFPKIPATSMSSSGYVLAPAYKFPDRAVSVSSANQDHERMPKTSYFMADSTHQSSTAGYEQQRSLTPSTSRSSLSSNKSDSNPNQISEQARLELQDYFNSFEHARASRRRQSTW